MNGQARVKIPDTTEGMIAELNDIESLLTARGWHRAAIVYAFTYEPGSRHGKLLSKTRKYTAPEFADLGIQGLRSKDSIYECRRNWEHAVNDGDIEPGDWVALPNGGYPPTERLSASSANLPTDKKIADVRKKLQDPEVQAAIDRDFIDRAATDHVLAAKVQMNWEEHNPKPASKPKPVGASDFLMGLGIGTSVVASLQRDREEVTRMGEYLERHGDELDAGGRAAVQGILDSYAKARRMISEYEDIIRAAMGIDDAAISRRILEGIDG